MNEDHLKQSIRSKSVRALNPHFFGPAGGVCGSESKPAPAKALEHRHRQQRGSSRCMVEVVIWSLRGAECDDDNLAGAYKTLRDCIAQTLGLDDGDPRIRFRYIQCVTQSKPHTIVTITEL